MGLLSNPLKKLKQVKNVVDKVKPGGSMGPPKPGMAKMSQPAQPVNRRKMMKADPTFAEGGMANTSVGIGPRKPSMGVAQPPLPPGMSVGGPGRARPPLPPGMPAPQLPPTYAEGGRVKGTLPKGRPPMVKKVQSTGKMGSIMAKGAGRAPKTKGKC